MRGNSSQTGFIQVEKANDDQLGILHPQGNCQIQQYKDRTTHECKKINETNVIHSDALKVGDERVPIIQ